MIATRQILNDKNHYHYWINIHFITQQCRMIVVHYCSLNSCRTFNKSCWSSVCLFVHIHLPNLHVFWNSMIASIYINTHQIYNKDRKLTKLLYLIKYTCIQKQFSNPNDSEYTGLIFPRKWQCHDWKLHISSKHLYQQVMYQQLLCAR